jgi:hypothetical protein|tara:strand:+ start:146 stop:496 length:351 start_codon:yes stop_codon:yes gene_type:complete
MGYRSEVVFACYADAVPTMIAAVSKSPALKGLLFADADHKMLGDYDGSGSYLFAWSWIKWYSDSPWVAAFDEMIEKIEAKLGEEVYRFVRMGEDPDDSEESGRGFEHIGITRRLEY